MAGAKKSAARSISKSESVRRIAEKTGRTKKEVTEVLDALVELIQSELRTTKQYTLYGLVKIKVVNTPAKPAREGRNPSTGETMMFKAKPAGKSVRARALKLAKDMA